MTATTATFANDRNLRAYALALLRHHSLQVAGKEEGVEFEAIEDKLSELWEALSETQRHHARGISSDLNWIRRGYSPPPKGRKPEEVSQGELDEFHRLHEAKDYAPLLHSLRICAAALSAVFVASCRAACYNNLGLPEVALAFHEAAEVRSPTSEREVAIS